MDPFVATIVKRSAVILAGFAALGVLTAALYGLYQYAQLQRALTLNIVPPALP
jgi:hypothetical protein